MTWLCKSKALLNPEAMERKYAQQRDDLIERAQSLNPQARKTYLQRVGLDREQPMEYPLSIAIETSQKAIERNPADPAVNVVLYSDHDCLELRNDFYFEAMSAAMGFCKAQYFVQETDWTTTQEWEPVEDERQA